MTACRRSLRARSTSLLPLRTCDSRLCTRRRHRQQGARRTSASRAHPDKTSQHNAVRGTLTTHLDLSQQLALLGLHLGHRVAQVAQLRAGDLVPRSVHHLALLAHQAALAIRQVLPTSAPHTNTPRRRSSPGCAYSTAGPQHVRQSNAAPARVAAWPPGPPAACEPRPARPERHRHHSQQRAQQVSFRRSGRGGSHVQHSSLATSSAASGGKGTQQGPGRVLLTLTACSCTRRSSNRRCTSSCRLLASDSVRCPPAQHPSSAHGPPGAEEEPLGSRAKGPHSPTFLRHNRHTERVGPSPCPVSPGGCG